jgi:signal transduction histidine kinase/CheY-like chemotaxis protein
MMQRWRIRTRVLFLALVPTSMIVVVLATFFTYFRALEIGHVLEERGAAIARHVARMAEFGLFSGDRAALQRIADDARSEADVDSVVIFDADSHAMAQSPPARDASQGTTPPGPQVARIDSRRLVFTEPVLQTLLQFSDVPETSGPSTAKKLGEVRVEMSRLSTESAKREAWLIALAIGSLCLAVAAILAHTIGRSVSDPVRTLAGAIGTLASGDLSIRVEAGSGGELRALAEGINQMAAALQASHRELEERIAQATQQLMVQKDAAESANLAKSRFLAAASHDLRQPLHAIELFAAALRRKVKGRETRELSGKLEQAIFSMDTLFNSLLDVYQLDSGVLKPDQHPFRVQELFDSLDTEFRRDAESRGLRLRIVPTGKVAHSDPILLHRVLANLLSNALRYTVHGSVMVICRSEEDGLRIEIRDSGPGIPKGEQGNIFREFYRIEVGDRDRGMGLGLTIVSRIAALLITEVKVRSKPDRGSIFSIRIARGPTLAADRPDDRHDLQALRAPRLGLIIVDNDPLVLQSTLALTQDWGVEVLTATNATQAHNALQSMTQQAVLVLSDLWLSGQEDGLALLAELGGQTGREVYGVIMTGDTRLETIQRIHSAGCSVLHKPVSAAKLRATLTYFAAKSASGTSSDGSSPA